MKKLLLLTLSAFSIIAKSQTSVYHPFPDSGAVWNFSTGHWCGIEFGYDALQKYYSIRVSGDTLINDTNYNKLIVPTQIYHSDGMCNMYGTWATAGYYAGAIRQDIANKKVFFVDTASNLEQLLYDFNMQVGDSVKGFLNPFSSFEEQRTVYAIDSILVGNSYRKRWILSNCYWESETPNDADIYFLEGIGCNGGLIDRNAISCSFDIYNSPVLCFTQNDTAFAPPPYTTCSYLPCNSHFFLKLNNAATHNWNLASNSSGIPPFSYLWSWGDGSSDTAAYPSHTYASAGHYSICLNVTDSQGCTSSYCDTTITTSEMLSVNVVNSFPVGIDETKITDNQLSIYPNPANQILHITTPIVNFQLSIVNLTGQTLLTTKLKNGEAQVDVSHLDNGIYFLKTDNGKTQKLIIQH